MEIKFWKSGGFNYNGYPFKILRGAFKVNERKKTQKPMKTLLSFLLNYLKQIFLFFPLLLGTLHCTSAQIHLHDDKIEPVLQKAVKINNEQYENILKKDRQGVHDLYVLAMDRSEKIAISSEDLIQSHEKTRQAWAAILPQISFLAGVYTPTNIYSSGSGSFSRGYRFYARQNLINGLDEISAIRAAPVQEKFSQEQLKASAALLYDQIAQVFIQYLILQENYKTEQLLLENSKDLKNELQRRFYLGKVRRSEILSVDMVVEKTMAKIEDIKVQLENAKVQIRLITGLEKDFNPDLSEINSLTGKDFSADKELDLNKRPDIMTLKLAWDLSKLQTQKALGGHLPSIYLEGYYRLPDSNSSSSGGDVYGGFVATIPLFSGGKVHSQYLSAKSQERQAALRYQEAVRSAQDEFNYYLLAWRKSRKTMEILKSAMEKAQTNYQVIRNDYRLGQATNLEVISALNDAANAKQDFETARLNEKFQIFHLKYLNGDIP